MTTRKSFLASGAALAALAPSAASAATASPSPAPPGARAEPTASAKPPPAFALSAFDAALQTDAAHRHLFASIKIDGGEVLGAMRGTLDAYAGMGVAATDVRPVAVLYHGIAIALGFDDVVWNEFFLPVLAKSLHGTDERSVAMRKDFASVIDAKKKGNPCLHKRGGKDDSSIEALVADAGAHFFMCNMATHGVAAFIARELDTTPDAVYATMAAHLVPNAMLVPAGVWAVHAVQERRYTLLQTSL